LKLLIATTHFFLINQLQTIDCVQGVIIAIFMVFLSSMLVFGTMLPLLGTQVYWETVGSGCVIVAWMVLYELCLCIVDALYSTPWPPFCCHNSPPSLPLSVNRDYVLLCPHDLAPQVVIGYIKAHSLIQLHRRRLTGPSNQLGTPPRRQITGKLTLPHSWDFHPAVTGQLARSHSRQKENCTPFHRPSGRKHRQGNRKAGYSNHRPPIQPKERGRNKS
jgi:hypothetical protein